MNTHGDAGGGGVRREWWDFLALTSSAPHMKRMTNRLPLRAVLILLGLNVALAACAAENPFIGDWELTISGSGGSAGWLGVQDKGGQLVASILWRSGSVVPVDSASYDGKQLLLT